MSCSVSGWRISPGSARETSALDRPACARIGRVTATATIRRPSQTSAASNGTATSVHRTNSYRRHVPSRSSAMRNPPPAGRQLSGRGRPRYRRNATADGKCGVAGFGFSIQTIVMARNSGPSR